MNKKTMKMFKDKWNKRESMTLEDFILSHFDVAINYQITILDQLENAKAEFIREMKNTKKSN